MTNIAVSAERLAAALHEWLGCGDPKACAEGRPSCRTFDAACRFVARAVAERAVVPVASLADDEALVERVGVDLNGSRLLWGTHSDRWTDLDWQRDYWRETAQTALHALAAALEDR